MRVKYSTIAVALLGEVSRLGIGPKRMEWPLRFGEIYCTVVKSQSGLPVLRVVLMDERTWGNSWRKIPRPGQLK